MEREHSPLVPADDSITIDTTNLNPIGVVKEIKTKAQLNSLDNNLFAIEGELNIILSEFDVERPSLLFVEIEDLVKIQYSIKGVHNE